MEVTIKQTITAKDLLEGISWIGETNHDREAVKKLKELDELLTNLVQEVYFLRNEMQQMAENYHNVHVVEIATDEEVFFLYNPETEQYLVELIFGDKKWVKEGELDSVPRTWTFTEKDIIEKFGSENLKYKLSVLDWKKLKEKQ